MTITYKSFLATVHPDDLVRVIGSLHDAMFKGKPYEIDRRVVRPDGEERIVHARGEIVFDKTGVPVRMVGTIRDITEQRRAEEEIKRLNHQKELILESAAEGIFGLDPLGKIVFANSAATEMTGYETRELIGRHGHETWHHSRPDGRPYIPRDCPIYKTVLKGAVYVVDDEVFWRKDGTSFPVRYKSSPMLTAAGQRGAVVVFDDITGQKRAEEAMRAIALVDDLTGLYNRRGFMTVARQQLKVARRNKWGVSIIFADIDGMKWINDHLGHSEGDTALIEAAVVFKETFRESDVIGRLGGDEFAVLVMETRPDDLEKITARLERIIKGHNAAEGRKFMLTLSMGIARCGPDCSHDIDELLNRADSLMYRQKRKKETGEREKEKDNQLNMIE